MASSRKTILNKNFNVLILSIILVVYLIQAKCVVCSNENSSWIKNINDDYLENTFGDQNLLNFSAASKASKITKLGSIAGVAGIAAAVVAGADAYYRKSNIWTGISNNAVWIYSDCVLNLNFANAESNKDMGAAIAPLVNNVEYNEMNIVTACPVLRTGMVVYYEKPSYKFVGKEFGWRQYFKKELKRREYLFDIPKQCSFEEDDKKANYRYNYDMNTNQLLSIQITFAKSEGWQYLKQAIREESNLIHVKYDDETEYIMDQLIERLAEVNPRWLWTGCIAQIAVRTPPEVQIHSVQQTVYNGEKMSGSLRTHSDVEKAIETPILRDCKFDAERPIAYIKKNKHMYFVEIAFARRTYAFDEFLPVKKHEETPPFHLYKMSGVPFIPDDQQYTYDAKDYD